ncbi:hypothetical protein [Vibrio marisflavi]|uniref:Phage protein n=1 Tax=Vibrio marisflavi CECT 7928 TaxID=634439 RepID=A0ABN8E826_9VIBR|nr:hypothetical protein [Vibrio marisflavi]CAH0540309.1 hypothetical protein VMF7928_02754 [Vibrio marisflavi CECT 7928]
MQEMKTYTFEVEITGRNLETDEKLLAFAEKCTQAGVYDYEPLMANGRTYLRSICQASNADDAYAQVTRDIESMEGVQVKRGGDMKIGSNDWTNLMEKLKGQEKL